MQVAIETFTFDTSAIRTFTKDGSSWFLVADIADALEYTNAADAARMLEADEKGTQIVRTLGGKQKMMVCNESGLYCLILKSRKPEAKRFRKWVTSEVLPSIRKTGKYQADWKTSRHAIVASTKVQAAILQHVREAVGKATEPHHYMNECRLINSLLTGEYKGVDRSTLTQYQLDFLAHCEVRNAMLIGMGLTYEQRKGALKAEALDWRMKHAQGQCLPAPAATELIAKGA